LFHLNVATVSNESQRSSFAFNTLALINNDLDASDEDEAFVHIDDDLCPTTDEGISEDVVLGEKLDTASVVVEDIHWRVAKLRLEEQNTRRFLKSRPRFLPYNECRKWVQALGRFQTEEDWKEWISMGEKRNPYIPVRPEQHLFYTIDKCILSRPRHISLLSFRLKSRPDEYYGRMGQWISWDHFLLERKQRNGKDRDMDAFR
jgi:hypothetical protein